MEQAVEREIHRNYPFESGISTDAYMIILLRSLDINDDRRKKLALKASFSEILIHFC